MSSRARMEYLAAVVVLVASLPLLMGAEGGAVGAAEGGAVAAMLASFALVWKMVIQPMLEKADRGGQSQAEARAQGEWQGELMAMHRQLSQTTERQTMILQDLLQQKRMTLDILKSHDEFTRESTGKIMERLR